MRHLARAMSFAEQVHELREPTRRGRFAHLVPPDVSSSYITLIFYYSD